jgi:hypothetical protein
LFSVCCNENNVGKLGGIQNPLTIKWLIFVGGKKRLFLLSLLGVDVASRFHVPTDPFCLLSRVLKPAHLFVAPSDLAWVHPASPLEGEGYASRSGYSFPLEGFEQVWYRYLAYSYRIVSDSLCFCVKRAIFPCRSIWS